MYSTFFFFFHSGVFKSREFSSLPWFWLQDDTPPPSAVWGCWPPGPTPFCPPAGHRGGAGLLLCSPWPPLHSEAMSTFRHKTVQQQHTFFAWALCFLDLAVFYTRWPHTSTKGSTYTPTNQNFPPSSLQQLLPSLCSEHLCVSLPPHFSSVKHLSAVCWQLQPLRGNNKQFNIYNQ